MYPWLNPVLLKVVGVVSATLVAFVAWTYVQHLRTTLHTARIEVETLRGSIAAERKNTETGMKLVREELERERLKAPALQAALDRVKRERPQVPQHCEVVLAPVRDAIAGVREIRSATRGGPAAAAAANLPPGP